jgi:hypothetical protein
MPARFGLLLRTKYSNCRVSGSNWGQRWALSPFARSMVVRGAGMPPEAATL